MFRPSFAFLWEVKKKKKKRMFFCKMTHLGAQDKQFWLACSASFVSTWSEHSWVTLSVTKWGLLVQIGL